MLRRLLASLIIAHFVATGFSARGQDSSGVGDLISIPAGAKGNSDSLIGIGINELSGDDAFGSAFVFLENGMLAAGVPQAAQDGLSGKGAVFLLKRQDPTHWAVHQKLNGVERNALEQLGFAVAAGDGFLAVSAPGERQIFIYETQPDGTFLLQLRVTPEIGGKLYGGSLSADGDTLAVGDTKGVYLYRKQVSAAKGWQYIKRISLSGIAGSHCRVALSGDTLLVGSLLLRSTMEMEIGGAAIYSRDEGGRENWGRVQILNFPGARPAALVGTTVALDGPMAAVGSSLGGAVYVFERGAAGWDLSGVVTLNRPDFRDVAFGFGLAIRGNFLLVGAPEETVGENEKQGAVYVFERNAGGPRNWGSVAHWTSAEGRADDMMGSNVVSRNGWAAIGAQRKKGEGPPLAYLSELPASGLPDLNLSTASVSTAEERLKPVVKETAAVVTESPAPTIAPPAEGEFKISSSQVIPAPNEAGPSFGSATAFSPDGAVLAIGEPSLGSGTGKVHVYQAQRAAWKRVAILPPAKDLAPAAAKSFGSTITVGAGGIMAIGGSGLAEIWQQVEPGSIKWARLKWTENQVLPPETGFGSSFAIWNGMVAIGAPKGGAAGVVRLYRVDAVNARLTQLVEIPCPDVTPGSEFGTAMSWTDAGLAIAAPRRLNKGRNRAEDSLGAVYHYRLNAEVTVLKLLGEVPARERESTGTFGSQLVLAKDLLIIADPTRGMLDLRRPGRVNSGQGAVTIYKQDVEVEGARWREFEALTSLLGGKDRGVGSRLAFDAGTALLAVLAPSPELPAQAAVHIFRPKEARSLRGRWVEAASFTSPISKDATSTANLPSVNGGIALAPGILAVGLQGPSGQSAGIWVLSWPAL